MNGELNCDRFFLENDFPINVASLAGFAARVRAEQKDALRANADPL